jgi:hypothetical protein
VEGRGSVPGKGRHFFLFFTAVSSLALGATQPHVQWITGALSLWVKWPGCEADHSHPSSAEVKNTWSYNSIPPYVFMNGTKLSTGYVFVVWYLVKHEDSCA